MASRLIGFYLPGCEIDPNRNTDSWRLPQQSFRPGACNRPFIGIELDKTFYAVAERRINAAIAEYQEPLFLENYN